MALELRLIEYTPYAGEELHYSAALPRAMYTAAGSLTFEGVAHLKDEGFVSTGDVQGLRLDIKHRVLDRGDGLLIKAAMRLAGHCVEFLADEFMPARIVAGDSID